MESFIKIENLKVSGGLLEIAFTHSEDLNRYFDSNKFWAKYSVTIENVPESVLVIPLLCQLLPIVWLTDSTLIVEKIDKDFYESIPDFKEGYKKMYPNMAFKGTMKVSTVEDNTKGRELSGSAAFFSGGVDAFATLISHIDEKPTLITVRGADIRLNDNAGWLNVETHTKSVATDFILAYNFTESNFTIFINQNNLNYLCKKGGDNWWHGFQHGIGLIGLAAPLSWENKWSLIYIASTFTPKDKGKVTCASDPDIDGKVRFNGCRVIHDCYELSRQNKIDLIYNFSKKEKKNINLRVCYQASQGKNCGICEKCIRTIFGIYAAGGNPVNFGFQTNNREIKKYKNTIIFNLNFIILPLWVEIQTKLREKRPYHLPSSLNWIYKHDIQTIRTKFPNNLIWTLYRIKRKLKI